MDKQIIIDLYTQYAIREDIINAHYEVWENIAKPGTWFTGAQRVAMAKATRSAFSCQLCAKRKQDVSPYYTDGTHDGDSILDPVWVDAIHRIVSDPARISKRIYDEFIATGATDAQYVELLSVLLFTASIDMFHRAVGIDPLPFPDPYSGEPSQELPETITIGAWVPVQSIRSTFIRETYADSGPVTNVIRALSLIPDAIRDQVTLVHAQYLPMKLVATTAAGNRSISRPQIELIASRVSALNECFY